MGSRNLAYMRLDNTVLYAPPLFTYVKPLISYKHFPQTLLAIYNHSIYLGFLDNKQVTGTAQSVQGLGYRKRAVNSGNKNFHVLFREATKRRLVEAS